MGIINDDLCQSGLVLGLGLTATANISSSPPPQRLGEPSLTLSLFGEAFDQKSDDLDYNKVCSEDINDVCGGGGQESGASYSSLSNVSVKRDREMGSEEVETDRVSSRVSDEDDDGPNGRKKLRLTKAQSALLEESFKHHSTLNPKQKQDLARDLNLRPRQVEVWFQNRRARTKLKQTEVDCEFLKKCCETLSDENRRLQKELQELKALKLAPPLYMQMPAATLTLCPSCERIGGGAAEKAARIPFARPRFYNPFPNPSAAC